MQKRAIEKISNVNIDILLLLSIADEIGWNKIRELSIYRILYLSSILYLFKYPEKENLFKNDFTFNIDLTGPYSEDIKDALIFLESNEYIFKKNEKDYILNQKNLVSFNDLPFIKEKIEWFKIILYILGLYGESKIYEFVIRDPQLQDNLERNLIKSVDFGIENETIKFLKVFQTTFEKSLGEESKQIDSKEYLELYFEYIFSKVLKGEI